MDSTNVSFDSIPNFPMAPTVGVVRSSPTPSSQKLLTRQAVLMDGSPYGGTLLYPRLLLRTRSPNPLPLGQLSNLSSFREFPAFPLAQSSVHYCSPADMRVPSLVSPSFSPASSFASTLSSYSPTIDTYHLAGYTPQGWIHSSTGDLLTTTHCLHHLSADDCGPLTPSHNDSPDATSEINACSNGIFATYTNNIKTECHSPLPVPEPPPLGVAREDSIPQQLSTLSQSSPVTALIEPYAGISPLPSPSASSEVDSEYHPARTLRPRRAPAARSLPQSHHSALSHAPTRKSPLRAGEKRKGQNRQAQWKYREKKKHVHKLNSTLIASMIAEVNKFGESDKTTKRQTETLARLVKLTAKYCEEVEETCPKICGELTANVAAALGQ